MRDHQNAEARVFLEQAMISLQGVADFLANTCTVGIRIADIRLTEPFG